MNYYQPYQRPDSGQWFYAMINDGKVYRVGNCADDCPGHASPEDAREHYRQYVLERATYYGPDRLSVDPKSRSRTEYKCAICDEWTIYHAAYGPGNLSHVFLCASHLNRTSLEQAVPSIGDAISSY
jgi:hypothetical protein